MSSEEIRTMRHMAFERARGELRSVLASYWPDASETYETVQEIIFRFFDDIDNTGL